MKESYVFYKDKLEGEYKEAFEQVELYINSGNYDEISVEDRLGTFMDMLLSAQEKGDPVRKIVGKDIRKFCKMFCSDMGTKSRILKIMDTIKRVAIIELIFAVLEWINWKSSGLITATMDVTVSGYFICAGIFVIFGFAADILIRSMLFRRKFGIKAIKAVRIAVVLLTFVSMFLALGYMPFIACPIWAVFAVCAGYLMFYYIYNHKRLAENKRPKVKFANMVSAEVEKDLGSLMKNRYDALNKRNIKKGKGKLSAEEFLQKAEAECDKSDRIRWIFNFIPIPIITVLTLLSDFPAISDMMVFIGLQLVVEYAIIKVCYEIDVNTIKQKRRWIADKHKELAEKGTIILEEEE